MNSVELKKAKRDVRRRVIALRDRLSPAERERSALLVAERFVALPEVAAAGTVLAFWSFGSELPTGPLLSALEGLGVRIALPLILEGDIHAREWSAGDPMREASFGALEPADGTPVDPAEVDVVATPAVAFDRNGHRVGYGGGYYDRFLPATRGDALIAGVALSVQLLDEPLPGGGFDKRVDVVVTESETVWCRAPT
jgi:5-formyltetrahydrofolate cyclo-ligase